MIGGDGCKTLIHYLGDHSAAIDFPHGNRKNDENVHVRTCPSVLKAVLSNDVPSNIYKKEVMKSDCLPEHQPVLKPRNVKQVSNSQASNRQRYRLSHDALYNIHELAIDLDGFIVKIIIYPDLLVICGSSTMTSEMGKILQFPTKGIQLLSYDTTFKLGDFYLSSFLFRHTAFVQSPVLPALFLIHENKSQIVHEEFMKYVGKILPPDMNPVPIVTDNEPAICNAIDLKLQKLVRIRCWNHTINAAKLWLKQHGATSSELPVYMSDLRELFHQPSKEAYLKELDIRKSKWSYPFVEYYESKIHPEVGLYCDVTHCVHYYVYTQVTSSLGRWILQELGVYSPFSGVTTNQSESFNAVLKRLQNWREVPLDAIVLSLYHLQVYYFKGDLQGLVHTH